MPTPKNLLQALLESQKSVPTSKAILKHTKLSQRSHKPLVSTNNKQRLLTSLAYQYRYSRYQKFSKTKFNYHTSPTQKDMVSGDSIWIKTILGMAASIVTGSVAAWLTFTSNDASQRQKDITEELNKLQEATSTQWQQNNKLVVALPMHEIQPLLQLHSKVDESEIKALQEVLKKLDEQRSHLQFFLLNVEQINKGIQESGFFSKMTLSNLKLRVKDLKNVLKIQDQQLKVAYGFCETLLCRKQKRFEQALITVEQWIKDIKSYQELLNNYPSAENLRDPNLILVNGYNHKGKIHRCLAGFDLDNLDIQQLKLCQESYEAALEIKENITVRSSLGFLLTDMSTMEPDLVKRESLLQEAIRHHERAKAQDGQDPNINHGLGYDLYQLEKCHQMAGQTINENNLRRALDAYLIVEQKNPNARLFHDKALIYLLIGDKQKALQDFNKGLMLEPLHNLLRYQRGCFYLEQGELSLALEDLLQGRMVSVASESLVKKYDKAIQDVQKMQKVATNATIATQTTTTQTFQGTTNSTSVFWQQTANSTTYDASELDITKVAKQVEFLKTLKQCQVYAHKLNLQQPKKIFISYAWGNSKHEKWVEQFATDLESAGFEVLLDRWQDRRGKTLNEFVERVVDDATDYIIVVGTHAYLAKYKRKAETLTDKEHVVKFEAHLINHIVSYSTVQSDRVIPIVLEGPAEKSLPPLLSAKLSADFSREDKYLPMLEIIRDMYRIDNRDVQFKAIKEHFIKIIDVIDKETPKQLAEDYKQAMLQKIAKEKMEISTEVQATLEQITKYVPS